MKIGVSSYSFSKYMKQTGCNYLTICDLAKEIGFDGIEFIDLSLDVQPAESLAALARTIREHCEKIGLSVIAYTIGADFNKGEAEVARVCGQLDIAKELGAPLLRHDATWGLPEGKTWRDVVTEIAPLIRKVTEYAASLGIRTCTENHGYVLQDAERVETLIRTVDHPNYGWLVDMGNFLCADDNAVHALPIAAPYAFHVHAKDFLVKPCTEETPGDGWFDSRNGTHLRGTVIGHGVVPVRYCVDVLRKNGYDGWLSLEFEGMEENLPALKAGHAFLRKVTA